MIKRKNELVYVKRHYLLPFKPLMDWEYKKFGYKKCDKNKGESKIFNTAYYVRHKERPIGLCDLLYYINLPLSLFRAIVFPLIPGLFFLSLLVDAIVDMDIFLTWMIVAFILTIPSMLITVLLGSFGYKFYLRNDTNGKLDRIMKSQGWAAWTSYIDNDPRFMPNGKKRSAPGTRSVPQRPAPVEIDDDDDDDVVVLAAADGTEIRFNEIAGIAHKGVFYAILQPTEHIEGIADDEALVFKVSSNSDGSDSFEIEDDPNIVAAVFKEYNRLCDEA